MIHYRFAFLPPRFDDLFLLDFLALFLYPPPALLFSLRFKLIFILSNLFLCIDTGCRSLCLASLGVVLDRPGAWALAASAALGCASPSLPDPSSPDSLLLPSKMSRSESIAMVVTVVVMPAVFWYTETSPFVT